VPQTYYEILGVPEHAAAEEIDAAFKSKASEVHPDRVSPANPYLKNIAAEAFKNLSEAKAVLLDAGKRQNYDAELTYSRGSSAKPPGGTGAATVAPDVAASAATARPPPRGGRTLFCGW
jgi:molecular chaperone DnaJ